MWRNLVPGFALDLTVNDPDDNMPWDFSKSGKRSKAMKMIRENRPYMVIGSQHGILRMAGSERAQDQGS